MSEEFSFKTGEIQTISSKDKICVIKDGSSLCVKIDKFEPYNSIIASGIFEVDVKNDKLKDADDIDKELLKALLHEIGVEARLKRVKHVFIDTKNPIAWRALKRYGWATTPKSKKNNICYKNIVVDFEKCEDGKSVRLVKRV